MGVLSTKRRKIPRFWHKNGKFCTRMWKSRKTYPQKTWGVGGQPLLIHKNTKNGGFLRLCKDL